MRIRECECECDRAPQPFLVAWRLEGGAPDVSWGIVLMPLWLFYGGLCCAGAVRARPDTDLAHAVGESMCRWVSSSVLTLPQAALLVALADGRGLSPAAALSPVWVGDVLLLVVLVAACVVAVRETRAVADPAARAQEVVSTALSLSLLVLLAGLLTLTPLFVALRLEGVVGWSWASCALPATGLSALGAVSGVAWGCNAYANGDVFVAEEEQPDVWETWARTNVAGGRRDGAPAEDAADVAVELGAAAPVAPA